MPTVPRLHDLPTKLLRQNQEKHTIGLKLMLRVGLLLVLPTY